MTDRTVMHIDMNAFFASIEQQCNPALRGKPVAVVGSAHRTVVTTASYEARARGVKTGMNKYDAKRACPEVIFVVGDNAKYMDASCRMIKILSDYSPLVEAFSIDEAFVDLTGTEALFGDAVKVSHEMKKRIRDALGITCSIGIAPNKLLAKLASDMQKPDGLVVIRPADVEGLMRDLPIEKLCGIGPKLKVHLNVMGITTCAQLGRYPASALRARFGIIGERLKLMGMGVDAGVVAPAGVEEEAKSVGHSMTSKRDLHGDAEIRRYILRLAEMVGARARRYGLKGRKVSLTIRYSSFYTFCKQTSLAQPTNDTHVIYSAALGILSGINITSGIRLIGISISELTSNPAQLSLFDRDARREGLYAAIDEINLRFGSSSATWAVLVESVEDLMEGKDRPGVISPSWRPAGIKRVEVG